MNNEEYKQEYEKLSNELQPKLTDDFLETLVQAAKTIGWLVDYFEVEHFVEEVFGVADKKCPDLSPFQKP